LWVDYHTDVTMKWAELFEDMEQSNNLDPDNDHHIWLLHFLFLDTINDDAVSFQNMWNYHPMSFRRSGQS
ncbi:hypothetical protein DACRYDRAFT_51875, partial [Dacryopinax primogenitus]